jgi:hypothetical protein
MLGKPTVPQQVHNDKDLRSSAQLPKWTPPAGKKMTATPIWHRHKMLLCQKMAHNMV